MASIANKMEFVATSVRLYQPSKSLERRNLRTIVGRRFEFALVISFDHICQHNIRERLITNNLGIPESNDRGTYIRQNLQIFASNNTSG